MSDVASGLLNGFIYLTDPGNESGHTGEDCGFSRGIASSSINKTSHSLYVPLTISALTVQRASRVSLKGNGRYEAEENGIVGFTQSSPGCSSHGMLTCSLLQHRPLLSLLNCPTSHSGYKCCDPPQEAGPAVAMLPEAHQLQKKEKTIIPE